MSLKIEALVGDLSKPFEYGDAFVRETVAGQQRIWIGLNKDQVECLWRLMTTLAAPFKILYVLHVSRTDASLGRYESPALGRDDVRRFFDRFRRFLTEDSRHDLWVHSGPDNATLILDRHNLIFAYGPLDDFERELVTLGLRRKPPREIPDPHVHHYHAEWDDSEREVLAAVDWTLKPLREQDLQHRDPAG